MNVQKLDEWIIFCDDYDMHFDEYLDPLLYNDIEDAILLGRKVGFGEPNKQLFLASFRSGFYVIWEKETILANWKGF